MIARWECAGGIDVDPGAIRNFERLTGVPGTVMDLFSRDQYRAFHGREPDWDWREAVPADIRAALGALTCMLLSPPCKGFSGLLSQAKSLTDTRILYDQARSYGSIEEAADNIRACGHEQVRRVMGNIPANDAKAATLTWTIMSTLREYADDFIAQAPHTRRMSVTEWETCEPSSILFVSHCSYSSPIAKVLRKKLATGLGLFARTAELTFSGDDNDVYDDGAIQLELGLPGSARHELVIDLWDDFDLVAEAPATAVVAPPAAVVVPISPLPKAPETTEADASAVTLLQPDVSATEIVDPGRPPPPDPIEDRNPTAVRRQQRRLLTGLATLTGLLGAWVLFGEDHSRDQHRSPVTVEDMVRRDRLEVEWVAKHEAAFEKTEATMDAR